MNEKTFDFIIIGSGMGGLFTAYTLADFGYSVCVLEKNQQIGGSLQVFSREKAIFDTGVHYIGSLDPDQNLGKFFKYAGIYDKVEWLKMDEVYDQISFSGSDRIYPISQGTEAFVNNLSAHFPHEREGLEAYVEKLKETCAHFPLFNLEYEDHNYHTEDFATENVRDVINGLINDRELRRVLSGSEILYGGRADKLPFYVHALVCYGYMQSAYKCLAGGSQIAKALAKRIREKGGEIVKRAHINGFKFEGDRISSATTKDGREFKAKNFISNMHPKTTFDLLDDEKKKAPIYKRISNLENTVSSFTVHIKFKPECFPYLNHNCYHNRIDDPWEAANYTDENWPTSLFICTPATSFDQEWADVMSVMCYMKFEEVKKWADTVNNIVEPGERGEEYKAWCQEKAEQIIEATVERFPDLRACIESVYTSSPLTYRDYIGNDDGSMYGVLKDHQHPLRSFVPVQTKVPNLFLTGQNLNLHGIVGVTISALATATHFVDRVELIDRIKNS